MLNNTILKIKEEACFGCGACSNCCPHKAISMKYNGEGFLFPVLNEKNCVECGLCLKACPVESFKPQQKNEPECYAVWADDNIRMKSSSGGMFTLLAEYVLDLEGYVCGAAFTSDYMSVEHIIISDKSQLDRLRRSKYVQSNTRDVYVQIEQLLKSEKLVLFSGCPCQVAGLKTFLCKEYTNLYTLDVVCHGANSLKAYHTFLDERANGKKIVEVNFREKDVLGWTTPTVIHFDDGSVFREGPSTCSWYKGFLNGIITRKSCGTCPFATQVRQSDITLADFWSIEKYRADLNDKKGTSMVLINSAKGRSFFTAVQNQMNLCEQVPYEYGWKRNGQLYKPQSLHRNRHLFFDSLEKHGYDEAIRRAQDYRLDVGIMGWWYNANYGGVATYFALHQVVKSLGYSVLMIDNPIKSGEPYYSTDDTMSYRFARSHYLCSKRYTAYGLRALNAHCDTFIVGSDQMWNYWLRDLTGPAFYLEFATADKRKIAYGASFGNKYTVPELYRMQTSYLMQRFDAISVREDYAVTMAKDLYDVDSVHVIDPVFLCNADEYESLIKESAVHENKPFICCYILNPNEEKRKIINKMETNLNLSVRVILDAPQGSYKENVRKIHMKNTLPPLEEVDWMYYLKNSSYIITDSFHGVCFSIIFHKPFLCLANPERGIQRFESLLKQFGLQERLIYSLNELEAKQYLLNDIKYDRIDKIISFQREISLEWLRNALTCSKERHPTSYDILSRENQQLRIELYKLREAIERINKEFDSNQQRENKNHMVEGNTEAKKERQFWKNWGKKHGK